MSIAGWCSADDVVDFDVVVLFADTSSVHRIGELDEDRIFLHDPLDVLTADTNDALVVLIGYMEGDRCGHLLLNKIKTIPRGFVLGATDINVEVVFVKPIKDDLDIACNNIRRGRLVWKSGPTLAHYLVDLPVLLPTHKLLMLIGKFDLDTDLVLSSLDEWNEVNDHHCSLDSVV